MAESEDEGVAFLFEAPPSAPPPERSLLVAVDSMKVL